MITTRGLQVDIREDLKTQLTVKPEINKDYNFGEDVSYKVYNISSTKMYVPRNYPLEYDGEIVNTIPDGIVCNHMKFEGVLKTSTNQIEASDTVYYGLINKTVNKTKTQDKGNSLNCGILSLPTGYGKTTVALHIMCRLKQKTLVIVHKEFLMNQWTERIKQFVPNARIGYIQGSKIDVEHKDVVIGMLQSLSMKEYDRSIFKDFGFTIIDETHHICTKTFSKSLLKHNTKYVLGLSATIERKDGLTKVLHWFLGPILYQVHRENKRDVVVCRNVYTCDEYKEDFPLNKARKANMPYAINKLTESCNRNIYIDSIIKRCVLEEGRKVLVLSDRRQHCIDLLETCEYTKGGLYIGGMKQHELNESEKCDVIYGTFTLAHEGLDIPDLDTLVLATPKSDIVQSVGRILRETPGKKNHPLVVDIIDEWGPFRVQYYKRCKYYKATGFTIVNEKEASVKVENT